jgi:hypothetical protein
MDIDTATLEASEEGPEYSTPLAQGVATDGPDRSDEMLV